MLTEILLSEVVIPDSFLSTAVCFFRPPVLAGNADAAHSSSSLSIRDVFRQRYSVTWHPRLSYFIVSDGYMATVLRLLGKPSPALLMRTLLQDATKELQRASEKLAKSQVRKLPLTEVLLFLFICIISF